MSDLNNYSLEIELNNDDLYLENEDNDFDNDGDDTMTFKYKGRQYNEDIMDEMLYS